MRFQFTLMRITIIQGKERKRKIASAAEDVEKLEFDDGWWDIMEYF